MKPSYLVTLLGMTAFLISTQAYSADAVVEETIQQESLMDRIYLNYFTVFHGPALRDPDSAFTVDQFGNTSPFNAINLDGDITAAYLITPSIGVGPVMPFIFSPVMGRGAILGDVGIKAFNKKIFAYDGLRVSSSAAIQFPTSESSQKREMDFAVKIAPNVHYEFSRSRFSIGSLTEAKAYIGSIDKTFKLWAIPYTNYRLTENFSLSMKYEIEAHHYKGDANFDFKTYQTSLQPGVIFTVGRNFMINPYIQFFTQNNISSEQAALGAVMNVTL